MLIRLIKSVLKYYLSLLAKSFLKAYCGNLPKWGTRSICLLIPKSRSDNWCEISVFKAHTCCRAMHRT